jgi:DNA-binding transcriptional regulator GbsR (MarR family)
MQTKGQALRDARMRLVEAGGRAAQDFGFSRILGQILAFLYFSDGERSLDEIETELGVSKATSSGATRQLETLGLLRRCWRQGDRKVYFRTADNLGVVFRDGIVALARRKIASLASELEQTHARLNGSEKTPDPGARFLIGRIRRAQDVSARAGRILNSRIMRYLAR